MIAAWPDLPLVGMPDVVPAKRDEVAPLGAEKIGGARDKLGRYVVSEVHIGYESNRIPIKRWWQVSEGHRNMSKLEGCCRRRPEGVS